MVYHAPLSTFFFPPKRKTKTPLLSIAVPMTTLKPGEQFPTSCSFLVLHYSRRLFSGLFHPLGMEQQKSGTLTLTPWFPPFPRHFLSFAKATCSTSPVPSPSPSVSWSWRPCRRWPGWPGWPWNQGGKWQCKQDQPSILGYPLMEKRTHIFWMYFMSASQRIYHWHHGQSWKIMVSIGNSSELAITVIGISQWNWQSLDNCIWIGNI